MGSLGAGRQTIRESEIDEIDPTIDPKELGQ
jgi:hypothetical protein